VRLAWPFRREPPVQRGTGETAAVADALPAHARRAEWRDLPPVEPTIGEPPLLASPRDFKADLAGAHPPAPILQRLGHERSAAAPHGLVSGLAAIRPVQAAAGAPGEYRQQRPFGRVRGWLQRTMESGAEPGAEAQLDQPAAPQMASPVSASGIDAGQPETAPPASGVQRVAKADHQPAAPPAREVVHPKPMSGTLTHVGQTQQVAPVQRAALPAAAGEAVPGRTFRREPPQAPNRPTAAQRVSTTSIARTVPGSPSATASSSASASPSASVSASASSSSSASASPSGSVSASAALPGAPRSAAISRRVHLGPPLLGRPGPQLTPAAPGGPASDAATPHLSPTGNALAGSRPKLARVQRHADAAAPASRAEPSDAPLAISATIPASAETPPATGVQRVAHGTADLPDPYRDAMRVHGDARAASPLIAQRSLLRRPAAMRTNLPVPAGPAGSSFASRPVDNPAAADQSAMPGLALRRDETPAVPLTLHGAAATQQSQPGPLPVPSIQRSPRTASNYIFRDRAPGPAAHSEVSFALQRANIEENLPRPVVSRAREDEASPGPDAGIAAAAAVQRADAVPSAPTPSAPRAAETNASGSASGGAGQLGDREVEELLGRLYPRLRMQLSRELLVARERSGLLTDLH
jgi:hypothetical protein